MIDEVFTLVFWASVLRIALPFVLAALCGAITERAGMIDLALEAKLLFGAFAAAAVSLATGSPSMPKRARSIRAPEPMSSISGRLCRRAMATISARLGCSVKPTTT